MDLSYQPLIALVQVVMIDVALAGDNAIVVGLAASRVAPEARRKVIFWGIAGAVVLRVLFAVLATRLFAIIGLGLSILLMAVAANFIARLLVRHAWIGWLGFAIVLYVALEMIWRGAYEVAAHT